MITFCSIWVSTIRAPYRYSAIITLPSGLNSTPTHRTWRKTKAHLEGYTFAHSRQVRLVLVQVSDLHLKGLITRSVLYTILREAERKTKQGRVSLVQEVLNQGLCEFHIPVDI